MIEHEQSDSAENGHGGWHASIALAVVMVLAVALRLFGLHYSLWNDEVASVQFAETPVRLLWSDWMVRETNPPLYYSLLHGWVATFGESDAALRLLSVLVGSLGIVFVFALGRRVGGTWTGVVAAALVAVSAQNILYSQQVRAYILAYAGATVAILAAIAFLDAVRHPDEGRRRKRALGLYVISSTVALYSHTTMMLLPALVGVFVLGRLIIPTSRAWRPAAEWVAANIVLLMVWSWWARITILQAQTRATIGWIDTPSLPYAIRMMLESYLPWQIGPAQYLVAALAVVVAMWGAWQWRARPDHLLLPFLAGGLPTMLYLLSLKVPMFLDRTVYWGSAPFLVTVATGIVCLPTRRLAVGAGSILLLASIAGWIAWFPGREIEPWRGIVEAIELQQPGVTVVVDGKGPTLALQRYCPPAHCNLSIVGFPSPSIDSWASGFAVPAMSGERSAADILGRRGSLVAVRWMGNDPMAARPGEGRPFPIAIPPGHGDNVAATLWRSW